MSNNINRRLSDEKVRAILEYYGKMTAQETGELFGCEKLAVWRIWHGVNYREIFEAWPRKNEVVVLKQKKISDEQAEFILLNRHISSKELAAKFGVNTNCINYIKNGLRRKKIYRRVMQNVANNNPQLENSDCR